MEDGCLGNIIMTNLAVAFRTHNIVTFSCMSFFELPNVNLTL